MLSLALASLLPASNLKGRARTMGKNLPFALRLGLVHIVAPYVATIVSIFETSSEGDAHMPCLLTSTA